MLHLAQQYVQSVSQRNLAHSLSDQRYCASCIFQSSSASCLHAASTATRSLPDILCGKSLNGPQHHGNATMCAQAVACGSLQVQATFAGGLQEHLQAAGGANAATAASLRETLGTSAQILNDLKAHQSMTSACFTMRFYCVATMSGSPQ